MEAALTDVLSSFNRLRFELTSDCERALSPMIAFVEQNGGIKALDVAIDVLASFERHDDYAVMAKEYLDACARKKIIMNPSAVDVFMHMAKVQIHVLQIPILANFLKAQETEIRKLA